VVRRYPRSTGADALRRRVLRAHAGPAERVAAFMWRARDEGFIRPDLPDGLAEGMLFQIVSLLARQYRDHDPAQAADIASTVLLRGVGK